MKTYVIPMFFVAAMVSFSACKKSECKECHYEDAAGAEVELGEYCDDAIADIEASGYDDNGTIRDVHCGEH